MKMLLGSLAVLLLAALPAVAQSPGAPVVCLASADDKGNVIIRSFMSMPTNDIPAKVMVDAGDGKKVEKTVKVGVRFSSEHIYTVGIKGVDAFMDGKEVDEKQLAELLAKEKPVLVAHQKLTDAVLKVVKKGTLILITPMPSPEVVVVPQGG